MSQVSSKALRSIRGAASSLSRVPLALSLLLIGASPAWAGWQSYRAVGTVEARVTAYCAGSCCCGSHADGVTSIGRDARLPGVAVDPRLIPYGWVLWVPGAGYQLADDTGGAMRQSARRGVIHVDLRMQTHAEALRWGVRTVTLTLYEPEDQPLSRRALPASSMGARAPEGRESQLASDRRGALWRRLEAIRERGWRECA